MTPAARRADSSAGPIAGAVGVLAAANIVGHVAHRHASPAVGPPAGVALVLLARRSGLTWAELGLGRGRWRRGLGWAASAAGLVGAVHAAGAALPAVRPAFQDARYDRGLGSATTLALVVVPLGTVIPEEVAFRGVLWGQLRRSHGVAWATTASSALFGVWHVLPTLELVGANPAVAGAVGSGPRSQALAVAVTGLAGVALCELRRRGDGLLAPVVAHWAANGLGALVASAVWRSARR